jgi:hypothetical protein
VGLDMSCSNGVVECTPSFASGDGLLNPETSTNSKPISSPPSLPDPVESSRLMSSPALEFDPSVGDPSRLREGPFVRAVFQAAAQHPAFPRGIDTVVVVSGHRRHHHWPALDRARGRVVVVVLGNEDGRLRPELHGRAWAVVQSYITDAPTASPPVFHLPLGPGPSTTPPPRIPWPDRTIDVLFIGHIHRHRWALAHALGAVRSAARGLPAPVLASLRTRVLQPPRLPGLTHHIQLTERFGAGLPHAEYLRLLAATRIALVPRGFKQIETFRHHEAARAGCILVGAQLSPYPVIEPPGGDALVPMLRQLLENSEAAFDQHRRVCAAWDHHGGPRAVGARLAEKLAEATVA